MAQKSRKKAVLQDKPVDLRRGVIDGITANPGSRSIESGLFYSIVIARSLPRILRWGRRGFGVSSAERQSHELLTE